MSAWWLAVILALSPVAEAGGDGPEISRVRGKKGGVVVLSPRVVPEQADAEIDDLRVQLQQRLARLAEAAVEPSRVSVRPAPERVCPQSGCRGVSLGVLLGHHEGGCFAVALVGQPEGGAVRLVPWAGEVLAARKQLVFRDPPEDKLAVKEFVPCELLVSSLEDARVERALGNALSESGAPLE